MGMLDWNDLRHFLAVAETGSTLAAARGLRVSQPTVARRIAALEEGLGLALFERRRAGYALTQAGAALIEPARRVAAAVAELGDAAAAQAREISGTVRLTMEQIFAVTLLSPILRELHDLYPQIRIDLDASHEVLDLGGGAADIALRTGPPPSGGGLVGRRIADDEWTFYCSRLYAGQHGLPTSLAALRDHPIVGGGGAGVWRVYGSWLRKHGLEDAVTIQHGSITGLLAAVRSGIGLAALPCFVADHEPDLVRCLPPPQSEERGVWLLTHERVRHAPRVRAVIDLLADRLSALARERQRKLARAAAWIEDTPQGWTAAPPIG